MGQGTRISIFAAALGAWLLAPSARADQESLNASLRHAARLGLLGDVRKLLAEGADVDGTASYGETALQYAALYGHTPVVAELLRAGAQINHRDFDDNTPIVVAAHNCNPRTVRLLLEAGADPNRENHNGSTPLTLATEQNCAKTVRLLLASPRTQAAHRDDWDRSALDYARENALGTAGDYDPETLARLKELVESPPRARAAAEPAPAAPAAQAAGRVIP